MKKIVALICLLAGITFLFTKSSAQFSGNSCEGLTHCSAPTRGISYKDTIIYLGTAGEAFDLGLQQNFDKQKILLQEIFIADKKNITQEDILVQLNNNIDEIKTSKILIINTENFDNILQLLVRIHSEEDLHLKDKTIYLVTNSNKFFLKRMLAKYTKPIETSNIYILPQDKFLNFLSTLSLGKITHKEPYITLFSLSFHQTPKYLIISYLIDRLIYHGFPIELITLFLSLSLGALVVSILRQIVGFSIFGIYSPLLFAVSMSVLGIPFSMILLGIGLLTKILMRLFTKRMYLLHNAKTALLIILYFFLMLLVFGLNSAFGLNIIDVTIFANGFIIFPLIFIIIVSDKVFNEGFKLFSKGRRVAFGEFLIVSFCVYGLLYRTPLQHLLLSFPEILILIFILNIAVGRFTGLQLLEYFRFMPLIKKHNDSEEEEEEE